MKSKSLKNFFQLPVSPNRICGLDLLRAFAILFVVLQHGRKLLPQTLGSISRLFVFDGVSIFFVLSGFLIGGILIKLLETKKADRNLLCHFWLRRWFRTLPNYFFILLLLSGLHSLFDPAFQLSDYKAFFYFSQNLFEIHPTWFFPEAWSLSIEEWFYLLMPLSVFAAIKLFKLPVNKAIFQTAMFFLLSITFYRWYKYFHFPIEHFSQLDLEYRKLIFTRLDSLMYGVLGAYVQYYFYKKWQKHRIPLFVIGIGLFLITKMLILIKWQGLSLYACVFSFSITSIATLFLLPFLSHLKKGSGVLFQFFTYISLISYSMYLLNLSVVQYWILGSIPFDQFFSNAYLSGFLKYGLFWFLTIFLSLLLYKYFEIPMMKLRDRPFIKKRFPLSEKCD